MTEWLSRPQEERALLNPAFCATLLWHAARERDGTLRLLSFEESFLVLPLVLPTTTRETLPIKATTPLSMWLETQPLEQSRLVQRSRLMVPFTRTALLFGAVRRFLTLKDGTLIAHANWKPQVSRFERGSTAEVRACVQKARFVSKWFLRTGTPGTVLTLLGVRP